MSQLRQLRTLGAAMAVALLLAGCGGGPDQLHVSEARVGAPTGPNAALYFTARGAEEAADALLAGSTDVADQVKMHETVIGDEGTMSMRPVPRLEIPAGGQLILEPGGLHMMLVGVDALEVGDTIGVTLTWEVAGEVTIEAEVVAPADTMGDDEHEDH